MRRPPFAGPPDPLSILTIGLVSVIVASPCPLVAATSERPNIVFILSDDQGWADIGYHGSEILTPNIDRLAASGVRLGQHYVHPTCSPTRAALLFGKYPSRLGVLTPIQSGNHLPRDAMTLPRALRRGGYRTHISGKWHLGPFPEYGPRRYGFDTSYGYLHGQIDPYTHRYKLGDATWHRNERFVDEAGHVTDLITDEAVRVIESAGDAPFFLYVAYSVPHYPLDEPERWTSPYEGQIANPSRALYAASITHMDDGVGRIVSSLERAGKQDRTVIVFTSDNGGQRSWGAPKEQYEGRYAPHPVLGDNRPLRGWKGQLYEGGIRVPAVVSWAGALEPWEGRFVMHMVDWMPTLIRMAGLTDDLPADLDGYDMLDHLRGKTPGEPRAPVYWKTPRASALRAGDWKLILSADGEAQLFNLRADPHEERDLAQERAERVVDMRRLLEAYARGDRGIVTE